MALPWSIPIAHGATFHRANKMTRNSCQVPWSTIQLTYINLNLYWICSQFSTSVQELILLFCLKSRAVDIFWNVRLFNNRSQLHVHTHPKLSNNTIDEDQKGNSYDQDCIMILYYVSWRQALTFDDETEIIILSKNRDRCRSIIKGHKEWIMTS